MFCSQCGKPISESDEYCGSCGHQQARTAARYYPVSPVKFVLLNVASFNLYLLYWFYMNWSYIQNRDNSKISPIWRSIFYFLWCYPFLSDLDWEIRREHGKSQGNKVKSLYNAALAILFFFLSVSWRLPDPYWLVALLSFVPLLHAVSDIKALNGQSSYHYRHNSRLIFRHYALIFLVLPLGTIGIAVTTGLIPSLAVVAGTDLSEKQARVIREFAELGQNERIDFYYSNDAFSYEGDGNIVTDERVVSYYVDETGVRYVASAHFEQILSLHVQFGTFFEPTVILVCLANNKFFVLYAGTEEEKDRQFVDGIKGRLPLGAQLIVEEGENFTCDTTSGA